MGRQQNYWNSDEYINSKYELYKIFKNYLNETPNTLCDIGCGFAFESGWFSKEYNTDVWLLDIDADYKKEYEKNKRYINYGNIDDFGGYNNFETIRESLKTRDVINYKLLEPNDTQWNTSPKFDVIMSVKSMAYHYPITPYNEFIETHKNENTRLFVSIRDKNVSQVDNYKIKDIVYEYRKSIFVELNI